MTRLLLLSILLAGYAKTNAQNGYLITKDSVKKVGYLKYSTNFHTGEREVEFWETFEDDSPQEIPITTLKEYAIEKDTFKIFRHFIPFERRNTTIEFVHTDVIVQVSLICIQLLI